MSAAGHRVLVVDDEPSVLLTLAGNLEIEGFEVVEADSALRALELIEHERFDLVLSDVRMPGMDGVTLLRKVHERRPELPVILMTAFALESAIAEAIHAGVFTVLPKPLDLEHLFAVIAIAARRPIVLVVDEAASPAEATARELVAAGVAARAVSEPGEVLAVVARGEADICVVGLSGAGTAAAALIEEVRALDPNVACVALSGPDAPAMLSRVAAATHALLRRPVTPDHLLRTIVEARRAPRTRV